MSRALQRRGFHTGPVLDLSRSPQYDVTSRRVQEWVCHLLQSGHLRSVMLEPPCTTFSAAAHPACRSYAVFLGFDRSDPKTHSGNATAFACFIIFVVAVRSRVPALLEQPRLSKIRWLLFWRWVLGIQGVTESWLASCAYGAKFRKEFALLGYGVDLQRIHKKCPGTHQRVKIEGPTTKESAIYRPKVAAAFARVLAEALVRQPPADPPPRPGLENVAVNDLLAGRDWTVEAAWAWKQQAHINVLETKGRASGLSARREKRRRLQARAPFRLLGSAWRSGKRAFDFAPATTPSVPGRGMVSGRRNLRRIPPCADQAQYIADDPSRLKPLRATAEASILSLFPPCCWQPPLALRGLSASSSGWLRLALLLCIRVKGDRGASFLGSLGRPFRLRLPAPKAEPCCARLPADHLGPGVHDKFDSTLGYPGEGPTLRPRNRQDEARQRSRAGTTLPEGRVVLEHWEQGKLLRLSTPDFSRGAAPWPKFFRQHRLTSTPWCSGLLVTAVSCSTQAILTGGSPRQSI